MDASHESAEGQAFAHLSPRVRHVSQSTIRKKWKPLPQSSQDRVRAILLSLKTKRATCIRIPPVGTRGKPRTKKTKNEVMDEDYERAVEDVTEKYVSQFNTPSCHSFPSTTLLTKEPHPTDFYRAYLECLSPAMLLLHRRHQRQTTNFPSKQP
jgi:hypothetical protein